MFGFIYLATALISDLGYRIKELWYNSNAEVTKNGTYYGFDGRERDAETNKVVTWVKENNGDEVLWDRPGHVYRNLSQEKIDHGLEEAKKNHKDDETAFNTHHRRKIKYKDSNGHQREDIGTIYVDYGTGKELVKVDVHVNYRGKHGEEMGFYAFAHNPYHLVRMTEDQKRLEQIVEKNGHYSWTKYPNDESWFLNFNNNTPRKEREKQCWLIRIN